MPSLLMIAPAPVIAQGDRVRLDVKFVEGMRLHAALWPGRIACVLWHSAGGITFGAEFARADLPFDLIVLEEGALPGPDLLAGRDVIYASGDDHRCLGLVDQAPAAKVVYVIEYTLETRFQILMLEPGQSLLRKARAGLWLLRQEMRRRRAFRRAAGLQANGYPAQDLYGPISRDSLLYLDGRMTPELFATEAEMAARAARRAAGAPLRLIYSGRLEPMKGAQDLLPVARRLAARGMEFTLDIFGAGSLRDGMAAEIARSGLAERLRLHAPVDFATGLVPFSRREADLFLGCHRQSDPSCTYLEAMGCGLPVASYANRMWARLNGAAAAGWSAPLGRPEALADRIIEAEPDRAAMNQAAARALAFSRAHDFQGEFAKRMDHLARLAG